MVELEDALLTVRTRPELDAFLKAVLTPGEVSKFRRRWEMFQRALAGEPQRSIQFEMDAGIATVTRSVNAIREHGDIVRSILRRISPEAGLLPRPESDGKTLG